MDITTELKDSITICDTQGKKVIQPIEYEWRPRPAKHVVKWGTCCENKLKTRKKWTVKVNKIPTIEEQKKTEIIENIQPVEVPKQVESPREENPICTMVASSSKNKEKTPISAEFKLIKDNGVEIGCSNGFEILREEDPIASGYLHS